MELPHLACLFMTLVLALAQSDPGPADRLPFNAVAVNSCGPLHDAKLNAAQSNVYIDLSGNGALCPRGDNSDAAIFVIIGDRLSFHSTRNPTQEVWVDRSPEGQGKMGYQTQDHWIPRTAEFSGWSVDADEILHFQGNLLMACPDALTGSWMVWLDFGVPQPGGNMGCIPFRARAAEAKPLISCTYTVNATLWEIEG
jgi:hypothetical protein